MCNESRVWRNTLPALLCWKSFQDLKRCQQRVPPSSNNPSAWSHPCTHSAAAPSLHRCLVWHGAALLSAPQALTPKSPSWQQKKINPFSSWPSSHHLPSPKPTWKPASCSPAVHYQKDIKCPLCSKKSDASNTIKYSQKHLQGEGTWLEKEAMGVGSGGECLRGGQSVGDVASRGTRARGRNFVCLQHLASESAALPFGTNIFVSVFLWQFSAAFNAFSDYSWWHIQQRSNGSQINTK